MALTTEEKKVIINNFKQHDTDTGSVEVQIALLTERIKYMTEHLKVHKKDKHSRLGLIKMVSRRKKLLKYLIRENPQKYFEITKKLGIRK